MTALQKINDFGTSMKDKSNVTSLSELLESSRNLPRRLNDIGTVHLSLNEIKKRAYDLRKYNKGGNDSNPYTKAHYLLIGNGISIEDIQNELESIDARSLESTKINQSSNSFVSNNLNTNDLDSYMNNQKDANILTAIEQSLSTAARDFDSYVNQNINLDWKQRKNQLRETLSGVLKRESSTSNHQSVEKKSKASNKETIEKQIVWGSNKSKSLISSNFKFIDTKSAENLNSSVNPNVSYALRRKFELNAEVIYDLNDFRQQGKWYKLFTVFADLYKNDLTTKSEQLHEGWVILREFAENDENLDNSNNSNNSNNNVFQHERKFAKGHCSNSLTNFETLNLRKLIIRKSREYLESQFRDYINDLYLKKLTTKQIENNELISDVAKVCNFLEVTLKTKNNEWKISNLTFVNGLPIWAILFYLLRACCYEEAIRLVDRYADSFQKLERTFPIYLKNYCQSKDKKLSNELQARLNNEFNQYFKHSSKDIDPFRYATFKLIGRCDLARKNLPSITLSIEDWLWLHLSLINEEGNNDDDQNEDLIHERYSLLDLQKTVLEFGKEAFNGSNNNPMYLQTLILVGLYEDAVYQLFETSEIDGVHLAISLAYYGLLRVTNEESDEDSNSISKLLNIDSKGFKSINYARLIGYYTRTFKYSDPRVAAEYLFCICLCDGLKESLKLKQISLGQRAIRELVLETREFVLLLGRIERNGLRVPGIIEERKSLLYLKDEKSYLNKIAEKAAQRADEEGRLFDCILLYQLSEEYDTVLKIVNKLLGNFLVSIDFKSPIDEILKYDKINGETNIVKLAENLIRTYNSSPEILSKTSIKHRVNCKILLDIVNIEREFTNKKPYYFTVLEMIKNLDLIPSISNIDIDKIRKKIQDLNNFEECIIKNIPNLLIIEMTSLQQLINELNSSFDILNDSKLIKINELKQISKNCMIFAGLLQYKMPREIYTTLINLEINF